MVTVKHKDNKPKQIIVQPCITFIGSVRLGLSD